MSSSTTTTTTTTATTTTTTTTTRTTTTTTTTTTAASSGGYGPTIAGNPPTGSVTTQTNYCGNAATGYFEEYVANNKRYVMISGAPSHAAEYDQENPNPNTRC